MKRSLLLSTIAVLTAVSIPSAQAQSGDAPPPDTAQLLAALKQLKELNDTGIKTRRSQAYQQIVAAIGSPEKAVAFWKEAVKSAQFEGAEREGSQIRDWKEGDGEALNDKLAANAVVLHLRWLALTIRHAAGTETKELLQQVIDHAAAVMADEQAAEHFADQLDKAKDRNESGKHGANKKGVGEDQVVKKVHDQIMRMAVGSSPVSRWLQLGDLLGEGGKKGKGNSQAGGWEATPGNVDGIYGSIILPEFRASKDPRLLTYWDVILKRETDRAAERKLDVEQRDWTQVKRPHILWNRAQDVLLLGYRNRAINDMFNLVKTFPQHPDAPGWIAQIENLLTAGTAPANPPMAAPLPTANLVPVAPGTVPPPVPVPSAAIAPGVTPGAVPPAVRR